MTVRQGQYRFMSDTPRKVLKAVLISLMHTLLLIVFKSLVYYNVLFNILTFNLMYGGHFCYSYEAMFIPLYLCICHLFIFNAGLKRHVRKNYMQMKSRMQLRNKGQ